MWPDDFPEEMLGERPELPVLTKADEDATVTDYEYVYRAPTESGPDVPTTR